MTLADHGAGAPPRRARSGPLTRLAASPRFHSAVSRVPGLRRLARRDGEALFDVVAGFVHSQVLTALVELGVLRRLLDDGPADPVDLATGSGVPAERMALLCDAGAALSLLRRRRDGRFALARRGAALLGVPGLEDMIRHHGVLYRDLADPVALLRAGQGDLATFWPYVFGAARAEAPETAARYSRLMADSQTLVAEETLRRVDLSRAERVLDVGGGTGAFLRALGSRHPGPRLHLFDLPAVVAEAGAGFERAGLGGRVDITAGSFRDDPLPRGADVVTLVRVLYDHRDETVLDLLRAAHAALPPGGRVVVSEPMKGCRAGDAYFALYCMAMGTGRARTADEICTLLHRAGFDRVRDHGSSRPFVTRVLSARRG